MGVGILISYDVLQILKPKKYLPLSPFGSISFLGLFVKVHDILPLSIDASLQLIVGPAAAPGLSPSG